MLLQHMCEEQRSMCQFFFSSPEPKAQVSYYHSAPSGVRPSVVRRRPSVNFSHFDFFSRTAWWILMKLGRDEVLMVSYKCCCFSARSAQGRIQGGAKIGHRGSPSSRNFFFRPEGYSDKRMDSNDQEACGKKCCYFWFIPKSNFWRVFDVFLDFVILPYFNAISLDFYAVKCLIYIYFV